MTKPKIIVTGTTGKTGSVVVSELLTYQLNRMRKSSLDDMRCDTAAVAQAMSI
jgi:hypothetical protein